MNWPEYPKQPKQPRPLRQSEEKLPVKWAFFDPDVIPHVFHKHLWEKCQLNLQLDALVDDGFRFYIEFGDHTVNIEPGSMVVRINKYTLVVISPQTTDNFSYPSSTYTVYVTEEESGP